jgi:hypothetical protein
LGDRKNVGESSCNWRRNGPNGSISTLDVYDEDEDEDDDDDEDDEDDDNEQQVGSLCLQLC